MISLVRRTTANASALIQCLPQPPSTLSERFDSARILASEVTTTTQLEFIATFVIKFRGLRRRHNVYSPESWELWAHITYYRFYIEFDFKTHSLLIKTQRFRTHNYYCYVIVQFIIAWNIFSSTRKHSYSIIHLLIKTSNFRDHSHAPVVSYRNLISTKIESRYVESIYSKIMPITIGMVLFYP